MKRRSRWPWWAAAAAVCVACDFDPGGLRLGIQVDILGVSAAIKSDQYLRLAMWFGSDKPSNGQRPAAIFHKDENNDTALGAGNPEDTCLTGASDTEFDCVTHTLAKPGAIVWVGAFYEHLSAADGVPDDGEFLSFALPFTAASSSEHKEGLVIKVVDPDYVAIPSPASVLAELGEALVDGDADAFMALIHPFFASEWRLDYDDLKQWIAGTFSSGGVTFANPLSAPMAGFLSPDVRTAMNIKGVTVTEKATNVDVIEADVFYLLREEIDNLEVTERWKITTEAALDQRLISRIDVKTQQIGGVHFTKAHFDVDLVAADWSGSEIKPDEIFDAGFDIFDPDTRQWQAAAPDYQPTGVVTACSFGYLGSCMNGVTVTTDNFYRVRVIPIAGDGSAGVTSSAFISEKTD